MSKIHLSNKENLTIAYKLLHDVLFIILLFFFLFLIGEGILPRVITTHVGFTKLVILIFADIISIYILGNYLKISLKDRKYNKKAAWALLAVLILLIINSLLKADIIFNLLITIGVISSGYYIHKTLEEAN